MPDHTSPLPSLDALLRSPEAAVLADRFGRHAATGALRAGVSPKVISERIGHANVGFFLETYAHVLGNDDREAAEQAASFLLGDAWDTDDETSS